MLMGVGNTDVLVHGFGVHAVKSIERRLQVLGCFMSLLHTHVLRFERRLLVQKWYRVIPAALLGGFPRILDNNLSFF